MEIITKILFVIAISAVKFIGGPPLAYAYHFNYWQTLFLNILGGMLGVIVFSYASAILVKIWDRIIHLLVARKESYYAEPTLDMEGEISFKYTYIPAKEVPKKNIFSPRTRRIVRIWRRYGLMGIAFITPVLLSIPAGSFIASRLEKNREKILLNMFVSIVIWSVIITSIMFKIIPKPI